jgi:hypothetical protein
MKIGTDYKHVTGLSHIQYRVTLLRHSIRLLWRGLHHSIAHAVCDKQHVFQAGVFLPLSPESDLIARLSLSSSSNVADASAIL